VDFLKFTDDGFSVIGFWFCHLIFLFDNAPITATFRFGGTACARQFCRIIRILGFWPIEWKLAMRFVCLKADYRLMLLISQYLVRKIGKNCFVISRCLLATVRFV
jgi:hypothetical protein